MKFPVDLNFIKMSEDLIRVETPMNNTLVGFISLGFFQDDGTVKPSKRWHVLGHEYQSFKTLVEAAWALRDYYLGYMARSKILAELRHNDGREGICRRMKRPREERLAFRNESRKHRKEIFEELETVQADLGEHFKVQ